MAREEGRAFQKQETLEKKAQRKKKRHVNGMMCTSAWPAGGTI